MGLIASAHFSPGPVSYEDIEKSGNIPNNLTNLTSKLKRNGKPISFKESAGQIWGQFKYDCNICLSNICRCPPVCLKPRTAFDTNSPPLSATSSIRSRKIPGGNKIHSLRSQDFAKLLMTSPHQRLKQIRRVKRWIWKKYRPYAGRVNTIARIVFSHAGLLILLLAYSFAGAYLFKSIEGPQELKNKFSITQFRDYALSELWKNASVIIGRDCEMRALHKIRGDSNVTENDEKVNTMLKEEWMKRGKRFMVSFEEILYKAYKRGRMEINSETRIWTFWGALFYSGTIFTTIGYGNIAPITNMGRLATILYAVVGIPLMLVALGDFGKLLTRGIKFFWAFIRRYYYTGQCREVQFTAMAQLSSYYKQMQKTKAMQSMNLAVDKARHTKAVKIMEKRVMDLGKSKAGVYVKDRWTKRSTRKKNKIKQEWFKDYNNDKTTDTHTQPTENGILMPEKSTLPFENQEINMRKPSIPSSITLPSNHSQTNEPIMISPQIVTHISPVIFEEPEFISPSQIVKHSVSDIFNITNANPRNINVNNFNNNNSNDMEDQDPQNKPNKDDNSINFVPKATSIHFDQKNGTTNTSLTDNYNTQKSTKFMDKFKVFNNVNNILSDNKKNIYSTSKWVNFDDSFTKSDSSNMNHSNRDSGHPVENESDKISDSSNNTNQITEEEKILKSLDIPEAPKAESESIQEFPGEKEVSNFTKIKVAEEEPAIIMPQIVKIPETPNAQILSDQSNMKQKFQKIPQTPTTTDLSKLDKEKQKELLKLSYFAVDDEFNLPVSIAMFLLLAYLFVGGALFAIFEPTWDYVQAFYFCFISISTIGLGDLVPDKPFNMLIAAVYIFIGLSLTSMCINVFQAYFRSRYNRAAEKIKKRLKWNLEARKAAALAGGPGVSPTDYDKDIKKLSEKLLKVMENDQLPKVLLRAYSIDLEEVVNIFPTQTDQISQAVRIVDDKAKTTASSSSSSSSSEDLSDSKTTKKLKIKKKQVKIAKPLKIRAAKAKLSRNSDLEEKKGLFSKAKVVQQGLNKAPSSATFNQIQNKIGIIPPEEEIKTKKNKFFVESPPIEYNKDNDPNYIPPIDDVPITDSNRSSMSTNDNETSEDILTTTFVPKSSITPTQHTNFVKKKMSRARDRMSRVFGLSSSHEEEDDGSPETGGNQSDETVVPNIATIPSMTNIANQQTLTSPKTKRDSRLSKLGLALLPHKYKTSLSSLTPSDDVDKNMLKNAFMGGGNMTSIHKSSSYISNRSGQMGYSPTQATITEDSSDNETNDDPNYMDM